MFSSFGKDLLKGSGIALSIVWRDAHGDDDGFMRFEIITLCPIDRRLVDVSMLLAAERDWLNGYHARVLADLSPELSGYPEALAWPEAACAPL